MLPQIAVVATQLLCKTTKLMLFLPLLNLRAFLSVKVLTNSLEPAPLGVILPQAYHA
jgi:hypothetical protein